MPVVPVVPNNTNSTTNSSNLNSSDPSQNTSIEKIFTLVGKTLTFQNINFLPNFVSTLAIFLDDLWFYKFHRYSYPNSVHLFMERVDWMNYLRFSTWFFDIQDRLDTITVG